MFLGIQAILFELEIDAVRFFINQITSMDYGKSQMESKGEDGTPKPTYKMRPRDPSLLVPKTKKVAEVVQAVPPEQGPVEQKDQPPVQEKSWRGEGRFTWEVQGPSDMSSTYHSTVVGEEPYRTVVITKEMPQAQFTSPGTYPAHPNGGVDWGRYKREQMVEKYGSYPLRYKQVGPGTRRFWQHDVSHVWMPWIIKADPQPELNPKFLLDTDVFNEHVCANCEFWFECAGTHKMIPNCACIPFYLSGQWRHFCRTECRSIWYFSNGLQIK
jgi:hypothetical protein